MQRKDLREKVYVSLRRDLISGAITATERLGEERLAELYGVSRTPVREALARLQSDGLVMRAEDGLHPYRPRVDELAGLYELRRTLESRGITRAIEDSAIVHDRQSIEIELRTWHEAIDSAPDPPDVVLMDERFHTTVLAASGNDALTDALRAVNAKVRPVRMLGPMSSDDFRARIDEHIRIGELVIDGKLDDALTALLMHIDASRDRVIARAEEAAALAGMVRT
ncbi:GntR family transcriptional regulator [Rhodococcus sp. P1Y]|uniref:GntR family transcriptional regulator n=1 Tax=Rhodococcus sp. P1Y TaxID=1302308 RepID=UPI000EB08442|nr:GntR family transcriptional regulator [Rhodococcus sp. P1Y]AYJ51102.1 GntR family transcriptional regulator [Rhodococcus sp. P1Y]